MIDIYLYYSINKIIKAIGFSFKSYGRQWWSNLLPIRKSPRSQIYFRDSFFIWIT